MIEKKRLQHLDFMKGIAIFLVIVIHLYVEKSNIFIQSLMHRICIPSFVFVTGYNFGFIEDRPYISTTLKKLSYIIQMLGIYIFLTYMCTPKIFTTFDVVRNVLTGDIVNLGGAINVGIWYLPFYVSLFFIVFTMIKIAKALYDNVLLKYGKWDKITYYIILVIVSLIIGFAKDQFNTDFYYLNHAVIMQPFAIFGYLIYHLEKYINDKIHNENETREETYNIKNGKINIANIKNTISNITKKSLPIIKFVIFIVSTILYVSLSRAYGLIDIFGRLWTNQIELYISCAFAIISVYLFSKYICDLISSFILVKFVSYMGKRSLHICSIHTLLFTFSQEYYNNLLRVLNVSIDKTIIRLILHATILTIISIVLSYIIEREK